ncbi:macro domain-containing protein [Phreatobacter stygius]|uniref:Phosphatase n=1 Tax=Phreatobacter stygius TaxID=1940610 RepID=A0A4D7B8E7_9HYPH|nr:macro domain-containing protein [Phreatobacter stygius]QCI66558.1 phosphatase [Phreatobacter stygius]
MLIYRRTSIMESSAQTLVNTVNCVGVMGKGIAKEFKERYPAMFAAYKHLCDQKSIRPGVLWLWRGADRWVLNFPTKIHWKNPSQLDWIEMGLRKFADNYESQLIQEISFPRLGCGNGGLNWDDVRPIMEHYLSPLPIRVYIHDYNVNIGVPEHLEDATRALAKEFDQVDVFEEFVAAIHRLMDLTKGELVNLHSGHPFEASLEGENEIALVKDGHVSRFEDEDLWGIWLGLQKGLVTSDRTGRSSREGVSDLLSMISLLPCVRSVEVQKTDSGPDLAIEWQPFRTDAPAPKPVTKQLELQWR